MKFGEAVRSAVIKNYFKLEGRASRSEYWWFGLFFGLSTFVAAFVDGIWLAARTLSQGGTLDNGFPEDVPTSYFTLLILLALLSPSLSVHVRRFHDAGRGTQEAIAIFVLAAISSSTTEVFGTPGLIEIPESLQMPSLIMLGATSLYSVYIAVRKSVED